MIDQKRHSYVGLWLRKGRLRVVLVALAAVFAVAIVTVPSTFSEDAAQPLRTDRGPDQEESAQAVEPAEADLASAEQRALVVDVDGVESDDAPDLAAFRSKDAGSDEPTVNNGKGSGEKKGRSAGRSNGQQGDARRNTKTVAQGDSDSTDQKSTASSTTSTVTSAKSAATMVEAAAPTTASPTTASQTKASPTTASPTTAAPTTAAPTTAAPTTQSTQPPPDNLSGAAIRVGFENHPVGGPYNTERQKIDWADIDWNRHWTERSRIINSPTREGNKALQILYPGGGHNGGAYAVWEIPPRQEYYLSYYVMFKPGFDFVAGGNSGGKLPGLASGDLCSGGKSCDGTNGFTARYVWRDQGRGELYLYDMDRDGGWGRSLVFEANGRNFYFETGKWHHLVQRVRTNSAGNVSDGLVQVWMNGVQVVDKGGLRFQTNGDMIDVFFFSTFFGGSGSSWEPKWDSYTYFDDIIISPNRADVGL